MAVPTDRLSMLAQPLSHPYTGFLLSLAPASSSKLEETREYAVLGHKEQASEVRDTGVINEIGATVLFHSCLLFLARPI